MVVASLSSQIFGPASWWEIQSYLVVLGVRREHLQRGQPNVLPSKAPCCLQGHHPPVALSPPLLPKMGPDMDLGPVLSSDCGQLRADPDSTSQNRFPLLGCKKQFVLWLLEPGKPFLLPNPVRTFVT